MIYCVSDIHGEYGLFLKLMDKIGLGREDRLIILGDIIDKGRESVRLLALLLSQENCQIILGNHEYDFIKYYHGLMRQSEGNCDAVLDKLRERFTYPDGERLSWAIMDALEELPAYAEYEDFICVHSGLPLNTDGTLADPADVKTEQLVYDRSFKAPHVLPKDSKCVIYGHTPTRYISGKDGFIFYPRAGKRTDKIADYRKIHIDTGVYLSGVLGCLRIDDCKEFYVKE